MENHTTQSRSPVIESLPATHDEDGMWEDFWDQIPIPTPTKDKDVWEQAVETARRQDPQKVLKGLRFQGQGE